MVRPSAFTALRLIDHQSELAKLRKRRRRRAVRADGVPLSGCYVPCTNAITSISIAVSCGLVASVLVAFFRREAPEQQHLAMMFANRHGRRATHGLARRHVTHDTASRRDACAAADREMAGEGALPADHHEIA